MTAYRIWLPLVAALVLNALANIMLKVGARTAPLLPPDATFVEKVRGFLNVSTLAAIVLFAANVIAYRKALDHLSISVAYPVMVSVGLIIVTVAATTLPVLDERVTLTQLAGMLLIGGGVWLVASGG